MFKILSVAILWFASFFTLTLSLDFDPDQAFQAGLVGVIISMVIVAIVFLQSEYAREAFFGADEDILPAEGLAYLLIGCLTDGIPIFLFGLAFLIFIIGQLDIQ